MSSEFIYATVYQMMENPESYIGKTVRMRGNYTASWYDVTSQYYHYVVIQDATACCAQGLEFLLKDTSLDYPKDGDEITVVGTFETYMEEGSDELYCHINNAVME